VLRGTRLPKLELVGDGGYPAAPGGLWSDPGGGAPAAVAPTPTAAPVLSGTPTEGETLTVTSGTWTGTEPITYFYNWEYWEPAEEPFDPTYVGIIPGQPSNSNQRVLTADDAGYLIRVTVEAVNAAGAGYAPSNFVGPVEAAVSQDAFQQAVLAYGPVGYWPMRDASGSGVLEDISGNGRHAVVNGTLAFEEIGPLPSHPGSKAISFPGTDTDYAQVPQSNALTPPSFTIGCWATLDSVDKYLATIASNRQHDKQNNGGFVFGSYNYQGGWLGGRTASNNEGYALNMNNTHSGWPLFSAGGPFVFFVATYDGETGAYKLYKNGTLLGSLNADVANMGPGLAALNIGRGQPENGSGQGWDGKLAELFILPTVLDAAQIQALYDARNNS